jgi:ABC-type transport system involved in multi-copper enzyme maturation permease subunit
MNNMHILWWELRKLLKQKQVLAGPATMLVFALLGFIYHLSGNGAPQAYDVVLTALRNLVNTFFILFPTAFCAFLFSEEDSRGTLTVIASRPVSRARIAVAKLAVALLYSCGLFALLFVFTLGLGLLVFPAGAWAVSETLQLSPARAVLMLAQAHLLQAAGNVFLVTLVVVWTVLLRSAVLGFGGSLLSVVLILLASNLDALEPVLPLARLDVWEYAVMPAAGPGGPAEAALSTQAVAPGMPAAALTDLGFLGGYALTCAGVAVAVWSRREVRK